MSYKLIKGEFHVYYPDHPRGGPQPDGDTLKFLPDNPALIETLHQPGRIGPRFNARHMINLRFQGIDALETHYEDTHQHRPWAEAARDFVLKTVGYTHVEFFDDMPHRIASIRNHPRRGYILATALDDNGRVVAFVYPGSADFVDGAAVWLDEATIGDSLNAQLLERGLAYPAFYAGLPIQVKEGLADLVRQARADERGMWALAHLTHERTAEIAHESDLQHMIMWPKLFRRLVRYFGAGYHDLTQFDPWLRMDNRHRDDALILPDRELGNMHDIIDINGPYTLRTRYPEEDLIIVPPDYKSFPSNPSPLHRPRPLPRLRPEPETQPAPDPIPDVDVRIVGLLVNPYGDDAGKERVTLMNVSGRTVNLDNWALVDKAGGQQPLAGPLAGGDVRQLTLGVTSQVQLSNKGDTLTLVDADGNTVDQVSYTANDAKRSGRTLLFGG